MEKYSARSDSDPAFTPRLLSLFPEYFACKSFFDNTLQLAVGARHAKVLTFSTLRTSFPKKFSSTTT